MNEKWKTYYNNSEMKKKSAFECVEDYHNRIMKLLSEELQKASNNIKNTKTDKEQYLHYISKIHSIKTAINDLKP